MYEGMNSHLNITVFDREFRDFAVALQARKVSEAFEKRALACLS